MNCAAFRSIVHLDDALHRPDPPALGVHLANCPSCRAEFPEILGLFELLTGGEVTPPGGPGRHQSPVRSVWRAASVLTSIGGLLVLLLLPPVRTPRATDEPVFEGRPSRATPNVFSITTTDYRGRRPVMSRMTWKVWSPPPPRALESDP